MTDCWQSELDKASLLIIFSDVNKLFTDAILPLPADK